MRHITLEPVPTGPRPEFATSASIAWRPRYLANPLGKKESRSEPEPGGANADEPVPTPRIAEREDSSSVLPAPARLISDQQLEDARQFVDELQKDIRENRELYRSLQLPSPDGLYHRNPRCRCRDWWIHRYTPGRRNCIACWPIIDEQFVLRRADSDLN
jgi:hypothetical protein